MEMADRLLLSRQGTLKPLDDFLEIVTRIDEQIDPQAGVTYEQFLGLARASAFQKLIAKSYVEGLNAARADIISASAIALAHRAAEKIEGEKQFRVISGYGAFIDEVAKDVPPDCIRLKHVVRAVRWTRRKVELSWFCGDVEKRLRSEFAVVTLPLGLLRCATDERGGIVFDPSLTMKTTSLARPEVGQVVKVIMRFRERFWEDARIVGDCALFGFTLCLEALFPTWWTTPMTTNFLIGWAGGPAAEKLHVFRPMKSALRRSTRSRRLFTSHRRESRRFSRTYISMTGERSFCARRLQLSRHRWNRGSEDARGADRRNPFLRRRSD